MKLNITLPEVTVKAFHDVKNHNNKRFGIAVGEDTSSNYEYVNDMDEGETLINTKLNDAVNEQIKLLKTALFL